MEVAFCAAIGDVTPVVVLVYLPKPGKPLQNSHLHCINCWEYGNALASARPLESDSIHATRSKGSAIDMAAHARKQGEWLTSNSRECTP